MTAGALLDAVERAALAAFPDRAEKLIAVVERRLWFGPSARTERPDENEHDVEVIPSALDDGCAICARAWVNWSHGVTGIGGRFERYDHERAWEVRSEGASLRLPLAICGPCRLVGGDGAGSDDLALSDLVRALRASGREVERFVVELERRFGESAPPEPSRLPCVSCGADPLPPDEHRGGLCAPCWRNARAVPT